MALPQKNAQKGAPGFNAGSSAMLRTQLTQAGRPITCRCRESAATEARMMGMTGRRAVRPLGFAATLAGALLLADPAFAHHLMGGRMPSTFVEGLLSGLGHPVIGIDHLAFLVAVGIVVGIGGLDLALPVLFVAASALGVAAHVYGITVPAAELIVALTVLSAG